MSVVDLSEVRAAQEAVTELWYTRCPVPTVSGIALEQKRLQASFAQLGIPLSSVRAASDRDTRTSHYDHRLRGMFREGGNIPAIWARAQGRQTAVIGLTWVPERQIIVTRANDPIRTLEDLRGRRLGLPNHGGTVVDHRWSMSAHGFVSALSLVGLKPDDVRFVDIATPQTDVREQSDGTLGNRHELGRADRVALDALRRGEVDALYFKGVSAALALAHDVHLLVDLAALDDPAVQINNGTPRPITVDRDLAVKRPDLVARYLAVLLETASWAEDNRAEVVRIVSGETGGDDAAVDSAYGRDFHRRLRPSLAPELIARLEVQKNFLRDWNVLPGDFSVPDWVVAEPLAEAERLIAGRALRA